MRRVRNVLRAVAVVAAAVAVYLIGRKRAEEQRLTRSERKAARKAAVARALEERRLTARKV